MNLAELAHSSGEWLRGVGPEADIVVSSRVRLARNLADFPFTNRASANQKGEIESVLRDRVTNLDGLHFDYLSVHTLPPLDRQLLVERQLISREHAASEGQRGVAVEGRETRSVMINEEDHLRLQVIRSGFG